MIETIQIHAIDVRGSVANGPGVRATVFMQGCDKKCPGCHNPETWSADGGERMKISDVVNRLKTSPFRRVTISGGEPLRQPEALTELLRELKSAGFETALYTGRQKSEVPCNVRKYLNYLKTGEFVMAKKTSVKPYVGSTNQEFDRVA